MSITTQKFCLWCGVIFIVSFGGGLLLIAQFVPPLSPTAPMEEVLAFYRADLAQVRLGLVVMMMGMGFLVPFAGVITVQMKRIEGNQSPLAYTQLATNSMAAVVFSMAVMLWLGLLFRSDRDPATFLLVSDLAWLILLAPVSLIVVQLLVTGAAIFMDKQAPPVYPRWVGYFNIWCALLFVPGFLAVIYQEGPFAWDGILVFWLAVAAFAGWYVVMLIMTNKAVNQQK